MKVIFVGLLVLSVLTQPSFAFERSCLREATAAARIALVEQGDMSGLSSSRAKTIPLRNGAAFIFSAYLARTFGYQVVVVTDRECVVQVAHVQEP